MITDNSKTQISESNSNKPEKRNSFKDQSLPKHNRSGMVAVLGPFEALPYYIQDQSLEKSLDELESIQMEDEVKNVLNELKKPPWL
jgi:hypothetical protein